MGILSLIFPQKCRFCGKKLAKNDLALCPVCRNDYESAKHRVCQKCKRQHLDCGCRPEVDDRAVAQYISLFRYKKNTPGGAVILSVKDRKDKPALELLSGDMVKALKRAGVEFGGSVVTSVPRTPAARRENGIDQSYELARRVAAGLNLPLVKALKCSSDRRSQKELSKEEREERAAGLYRPAKDSALLSNKRVILIDDICTTGATLSSCARALTEAGAADVIALTAGKA